MSAWWWIEVALRSFVVVSLVGRTVIEARAGRHAWFWGLIAAVFLVLLGFRLHDARWG